MSTEDRTGVFKSFGKDTLTYVPYRLFPVLFGFLGLWIYTRVFTPAEYGTYSIVNITIGLLGIFAYSWINEAVMRFYRPYHNENRLEEFFSASFIMTLLSLAVIVVLMLALGYLSLLPGPVMEYLVLTLGVLSVLSFFETCLALLRSERMAVEATFYRSTSAMLYLVISLVLIYFGMGIASILISYIVTNLGMTLIITVKHNYASYIRLRYFSLGTLKEFAGYGLPLMVMLLSSWVLLVSDRYFIEYFKGAHDVGIYSAAYQLSDYPISMFTSMMLIAALPIIIDTWEKKGEGPTKTLITGLVRYYALFVVPAFVGISLLAQNLMCILTDEYFAGFMIVPFICLAKSLFGLCWYLNKGLELKKKTTIIALLIGISGALDIGLNLILVPEYGFVGSGIALGISYTVYCLLSVLVSKRYLDWAMPWRSIRNIVISAAAMGGTLLLAKQYLDQSVVSLILLVAIGALVYFAGILLIGEVREEAAIARTTAVRLPGALSRGINRKVSRPLESIVKIMTNHR